MRSAIFLATATCLLLLQVGSVVDPPALSAGKAQRRQLKVRLSHCRCVGKAGRRRQNATVTVTDDKVCSRLTTPFSATTELSDLRFHLKIVKNRVYVNWILPRSNKRGKDFYLRFLKRTRNGQARARHRRCFRVARLKNCRHMDCKFITDSQRQLRSMDIALFSPGMFIPLTHNGRTKSSVRNPRHNNLAGTKCSQVSCDGKWRPKVTAIQTGDGEVTVKYQPLLEMKCDIEVSLAMEHNRIHETRVSHNVSEIHFTNVKKGIYAALIRPVGSTCEPSSNDFSVNDVTCSKWRPSVTAMSLSNSGDVMVTFHPPNSLAKRIEVCMERKGSVGCVHHKEVPTDFQNVTFFNIDEGTYRAMVRPIGCFDCQDYHDLGMNCILDFVASNKTINVGGHTDTPVSMTSLLETIPNSSNRTPTNTTSADEDTSERQDTETMKDEDSSTHTLGINSNGKRYRVHYIRKNRDGSTKELSSNRERPLRSHPGTDCGLCRRICTGNDHVASM